MDDVVIEPPLLSSTPRSEEDERLSSCLVACMVDRNRKALGGRCQFHCC